MKKSVINKLTNYYKSIKNEPKHVLGLPGNMDFEYKPIQPFFKFLLNNIGDPSENSNYKLHSKQFEREVLKFFAKTYGLSEQNFWGYIAHGGTEANMHGILAAREKYTDGILYFSKEAHYSLKKIARILRIDYRIVNSLKNGEIDYKDLEKKIKENINRPVTLSLTIGTTFKGAIDNVQQVVTILKKLKIKKYYIHCDAALFGGYLPFVITKSSKYYFDLTKFVNSISISGHKFIGSPMPCGIFITRKPKNSTINTEISHIDASDTTISGSRNGHSVLFVWYAIKNKGKSGFKKDAKRCLQNTLYFKSRLNQNNIQCLLNKYSNILVFNKPNKKICENEHRSAHGIHFLNRSYSKYRDKCLKLGGVKYHQLRTFVYANYNPFRLSRVAINQPQSSQTSHSPNT